MLAFALPDTGEPFPELIHHILLYVHHLNAGGTDVGIIDLGMLKHCVCVCVCFYVCVHACVLPLPLLLDLLLSLY